MALPVVTTGCNVDSVIKGIRVGISVADGIVGVLGSSPTPPAFLANAKTILGKVKDGLTAAEAVYSAYEKANAVAKPSLLNTLQATVGSVQDNLRTFLSVANVNNLTTINEITLAVAVINTALNALIAVLPSSVSVQLTHANEKPLPTVKDAKTPQDLKKAWNDGVSAKFPGAVVK